ncbi:hypothetical protein ACIQ6V_02035 [Streptomyces sp. NPDC096198]|uniref:hypothetical protein n=1 Tax=Streptomyces sp. NPDC096198 TaxID=3366080 RepID=UPI003826DEB3
MTAEQAAEQTAEQAVEKREADVVLEYELRRADLVDAVRLILRKRRSGLIFRPPFVIVLGLLGVALAVLDAVNGDGGGTFGLAVAAYAVVLYLWPHLAARGSLKALQHQGRVRVTVGGTGVRMAGAQAESTMAWGNFGSYGESERVFVLRSPDRAGRCATVIAKAGAADPADVDRLRALLDGRLSRV